MREALDELPRGLDLRPSARGDDGLEALGEQRACDPAPPPAVRDLRGAGRRAERLIHTMLGESHPGPRPEHRGAQGEALAVLRGELVVERLEAVGDRGGLGAMAKAGHELDAILETNGRRDIDTILAHGRLPGPKAR
ncbi:hypothetical protein [Polyangium mundeleinium]|uniref:Uncharacterized protein n=1 Tax=Polyangium mundeleinium TaxID=2995306 RepID=A0ABT5F1D9_9BACT|nr:hypothetical protein [Polyangium mundeleinium]MDC0747870.1 hypothetical protein [Polyangium mundeleinium]